MPPQTEQKVVTTVFYFGGSDCAYCMQRENIENINKMRADLPVQKKDLSFKFVLVVMDKDLKQGMEYAKKYPRWDEISIGKFYDNELMLQHVNKTELPGVPDIMVYRDSLTIGKFNVPTIADRTLLVNVVGEKAIDTWIRNGYQLAK